MTRHIEHLASRVVPEVQAESGESQIGAGQVRLLEHCPALGFSPQLAASVLINTPPRGRNGTGVAQEEQPTLELDDVDLIPDFGASSDPESLQLEPTGVTEDARWGKEKVAKSRNQGAFWKDNTVFKMSVAAKLRAGGMGDEAAKLEHCHTERKWSQCGSCGKAVSFLNRCDQKFCPECQPRLARKRAEAVEWWVRETDNPKHVVLTVRNSALICAAYFLWLKAAFKKLRNRKLDRKSVV